MGAASCRGKATKLSGPSPAVMAVPVLRVRRGIDEQIFQSDLPTEQSLLLGILHQRFQVLPIAIAETVGPWIRAEDLVLLFQEMTKPC